MQIVIDIPEYMYKELIEKENHSTIDSVILDGTPLPKGHGRLIDADELKKVYDERISRLYALNKKDNPSRESKICATNWCCNTIGEMPTIIEADKAESEG